ncbi:EamA family transporter [Schinkia azotoformans]|uniref:Transport protein YwfM n=1 Tax=Schinkia azotoformans LMG 9581 TaxID=1131731 RepID=K6BWK9_SCHAZ|nr:EamA family transporter [Schinkia azotoformans]EKN63325.1 transport protein YwfM [Schinkia azotoformans LMG 9581]MEC1640407.1 EamA family transporter [Schinkia azotoformans]MEC1946591.1 EamA family transporter [Schinkia azotoformans]
MKDRLSTFLVLLAAVLWGTTGTAQTFAPPDTHPISFGAMRLAFGGTTLLLFIALQGKLKLKNWPLKEVILAALCMACYQPFFFSAVKITGVAIGTVVAIGSSPILAGIMEWIFKKTMPTKSWWLATVVAISGCLLLFTTNGAVKVQPFGILLSLGAGLSFATYTLVSKELLKTQAPDTVVAVVFTLAAIMLAPLLFLFDLSWLFQINGIGTSLYLGVFATGIAYLLFSKGLVKIPAYTAVTLSLFEPLTAALLGAFLVGENLTLTSWLGVALIFMAIVVVSMAPKNKSVRKPEQDQEVEYIKQATK